MRRVTQVALLLVLASVRAASAQAPVQYQLSFPEPEHRWMQVEIALADLPNGPLELHMSRSSPGRYALHEFAKNVFDVTIVDAAGRPLPVERPNPHRWRVADPGASVRVRYRVYGDRVDGTYLAIDSTHAHINMPSALMWAPGFEDRPVTVHFDEPPGASWRVATQLFPGRDPFTFTAPNLQYLMDSPTEFSDVKLRSFTVPDGERTPTFRVAVHADVTDADLDAFVRDVQKIVREERGVFGAFAPYDTGTYTFIGDYVPWANSDAMEHRNSTFLSSARAIRSGFSDLIDSVAHEFFHSWNVERIRPRSLEPFNFDEANMSGELWLAEGFTQYYGILAQRRARLTSLEAFAFDMGDLAGTVMLSPARQIRTAEEMSRFAPFTDAAVAIDRTDFSNTFISYYTWGGAIAVGLDLTLRERSAGAVTLDDFMRELWRRYGAPGGRAPGYVDRPYTMGDLRDALATVSGDPAFAGDFFAKYIQGHDVLDYQRLFALAGLTMRPVNRGEGFVGVLRLQDGADGVRVVSDTAFGSPAYEAGLDRDDVITAFGGAPVRTAAELDASIRGRTPGSRIPLTFERRGRRVTASLRIIEDPRQELVPVESAGQMLSPAQRQFRAAWLGSRQ